MAGGEIFRRGQDGSQERAVVSGRVAIRPATSTPGPVVLAEQFRDRFVTSPEVDKIRDLRVKIETMSNMHLKMWLHLVCGLRLLGKHRL